MTKRETLIKIHEQLEDFVAHKIEATSLCLRIKNIINKELLPNIWKEQDKEFGDSSELRKALETVRDAHYVGCDNNGDAYEGFHVEADDGTGRPLICVVESALEKPPRNCDRFNTKFDAVIAWGKEDQGWVDWPDEDDRTANDMINRLSADQVHELVDWLLEPVIDKGK